MSWKFKSGIPIYSQIMDVIKIRILNNTYAPGDKLPGVRELAVEAGVNPNTMQRALSLLEGEGLVRSERTSGRYITDDQDLINVLRHEKSRIITRQFCEEMAAIGLNQDDIIALIKHYGGTQS